MNSNKIRHLVKEYLLYRMEGIKRRIDRFVTRRGNFDKEGSTHKEIDNMWVEYDRFYQVYENMMDQERWRKQKEKLNENTNSTISDGANALGDLKDGIS
jgi:hypothetical protein